MNNDTPCHLRHTTNSLTNISAVQFDASYSLYLKVLLYCRLQFLLLTSSFHLTSFNFIMISFPIQYYVVLYVHQIALCTVHCRNTNCPCIFMLSHVLQDIILSTSLIFSMNTYFSLMCSLSQTTHSFALLPNLLSQHTIKRKRMYHELRYSKKLHIFSLSLCCCWRSNNVKMNWSTSLLLFTSNKQLPLLPTPARNTHDNDVMTMTQPQI